MANLTLDEQPSVLIFLSTLNMNKTAEIVLGELKNGAITESIKGYYFGRCFGRYDGVLEIDALSLKNALEWIGMIQSRLWDETSTCLSVIPCYRLFGLEPNDKDRMSQGSLDQNKLSVRTYSFFRQRHNKLDKVFNIISKEKDHEVCRDLLWNFSAFSYLLRVSTDRFHDAADYLHGFRMGKMFLQDFCTFACLRWGARDLPSKKKVTSWVNIKICEREAIEAVAKRNGIRTRTGYFDLVKELHGNSLHELFGEIERIREEVKSDLPNRTATILSLKKLESGSLIV